MITKQHCLLYRTERRVVKVLKFGTKLHLNYKTLKLLLLCVTDT
jgi:hypothetical protein